MDKTKTTRKHYGIVGPDGKISGSITGPLIYYTLREARGVSKDDDERIVVFVEEKKCRKKP